MNNYSDQLHDNDELDEELDDECDGEDYDDEDDDEDYDVDEDYDDCNQNMSRRRTNNDARGGIMDYSLWCKSSNTNANFIQMTQPMDRNKSLHTLPNKYCIQSNSTIPQDGQTKRKNAARKSKRNSTSNHKPNRGSKAQLFSLSAPSTSQDKSHDREQQSRYPLY